MKAGNSLLGRIVDNDRLAVHIANTFPFGTVGHIPNVYSCTLFNQRNRTFLAIRLPYLDREHFAGLHGKLFPLLSIFVPSFDAALCDPLDNRKFLAFLAIWPKRLNHSGVRRHAIG